MDAQPKLRILKLAGPLLGLALAAGACAVCKARGEAQPPQDSASEPKPTPDRPANTRPMSSSSKKAGFGAAGDFMK